VKWNDRDGDGRREPDEPGLAGVAIYLDLNCNQCPSKRKEVAMNPSMTRVATAPLLLAILLAAILRRARAVSISRIGAPSPSAIQPPSSSKVRRLRTPPSLACRKGRGPHPGRFVRARRRLVRPPGMQAWVAKACTQADDDGQVQAPHRKRPTRTVTKQRRIRLSRLGCSQAAIGRPA